MLTALLNAKGGWQRLVHNGDSCTQGHIASAVGVPTVIEEPNSTYSIMVALDGEMNSMWYKVDFIKWKER